MRIAIIIDDFFPASGGIGRSVQTQIEELTMLGHEVTLIAPDRHLQKPRTCRVIECPTIYVEGLPAHLSILHCSDRRARLINSVAQFDIVHTQTERGALVLGSKLADMQGIPHLHTFHANIAGAHQSVKAAALGTLSYWLLVVPALRQATPERVTGKTFLPQRRNETGGLAARLDWTAFAEIAQRVDGYTVPSPFMKDLIDEASSIPVHGRVVPTGYNKGMLAAIKRARRERTDDKVRFLSVGRLAKEKRLDVLTKAFLEADLPDAELVFVGDGNQRDLLKRLAQGVPNIDFRWHLSSLDALAYELVNADVLTLASYRFDSQGLVITEAVAAGLPVLYCDDRLTVGLSPETALLTGPDVSSLAEGFRKLTDHKLRTTLASNTAALLPQLSPEQMSASYVAAYEELIKKGRHG